MSVCWGRLDVMQMTFDFFDWQKSSSRDSSLESHEAALESMNIRHMILRLVNVRIANLLLVKSAFKSFVFLEDKDSTVKYRQ